MNALIERLKALYGRNGGVCRPDTETPAGKAGAQEEQNSMSNVAEVSVHNKSTTLPFRLTEAGGKDSIAHIITGMVARAGSGPVTISPGIASRILAECNFDGQRKLQPLRKNRHERRIASGQWNAEQSRIVFARTPDGHLHLVDGQHRVAGIADSGKATGTMAQIIDCRDVAAVRSLYAGFDEPGSSRSDMEMLDGIGASATLGMSRKITSALFRAVTLLVNNLESIANADHTNEARERDIRLQEMPDWVDVAKVYANIISLADGSTQRTLLTQGVMASALYTLRHQPKLAREFWEGLADNDGLRKNDPRARLLADFHNRSTNSGNIRQRVQRVAVAWNAYYSKRDLSLIKCIEGAPIVFKGTPKGRGV